MKLLASQIFAQYNHSVHQIKVALLAIATEINTKSQKTKHYSI